MLRLRDTSGKSWDIPKSVVFIEVCDEQGKLAAVVHRVKDNKVAIYSPEDESFTRYTAAYNVEPTKVNKV